jgi:hypothetical protein
MNLTGLSLWPWKAQSPFGPGSVGCFLDLEGELKVCRVLPSP